MAMPEFFVLNDETQKNSHGFRLLNAGGDLERFKENPVMLDTHDMKLVIGKWGDLRIDGTKLIANPIFDTEDKHGKRIAGKVERGFVKAASLGIYIEDAKYVEVPGGDMELVVTKWEALEGSVLGVPSNRHALAFYSKEGVQLSADKVLSTVQTLAAPTNPANTTNPDKNMEKIILTSEGATALGVGTEHTDIKAIETAVIALAAKEKKATADLKAFRTERATTLVDLAVKEGRIEATRKDSFVEMATNDYTQASEIIEAMPKKKDLGVKPPKTPEGGEDRSTWDYMKWAKEDSKGLEELAAKSPEEFNKLREGYKPKYS
jgi:hypothetical protein